MRSSKILLVDALINLILGVLLVAFPKSVVDLLGVPQTEVTFYPSILGAILIGIALALLIEYLRRPSAAAGLGVNGAIAINLCGAVLLVGWLLNGKLVIPLRGHVFLWGLSAALVLISGVELLCARTAGGQQE